MRLRFELSGWELDMRLGREELDTQEDEGPPAVDEKRGDVGMGPGFGFAYRDEPINAE